MSLENQVVRVSHGMKDTLKALINKLGGTVGDELIDQYPALVASMTGLDEKQDKISGTQGQIVGFDENGNAIAQDMDFDSSSVIEQNKGLKQKFWRGTQSEYDALATKADDTMYIIVDGDGAIVEPGDMQSSVYDPQGKATDIFAYVDQKVASIPTPDVSGQISTHDSDSNAHTDIRALISDKVNADYVNSAIQTAIGNAIGGSY